MLSKNKKKRKLSIEIIEKQNRRKISTDELVERLKKIVESTLELLKKENKISLDNNKIAEIVQTITSRIPKDKFDCDQSMNSVNMILNTTYLIHDEQEIVYGSWITMDFFRTENDQKIFSDKDIEEVSRKVLLNIALQKLVDEGKIEKSGNFYSYVPNVERWNKFRKTLKKERPLIEKGISKEDLENLFYVDELNTYCRKHGLYPKKKKKTFLVKEILKSFE